MEKIALLPSTDAVIAERKRLADARDAAAFSTIFATPRSWLSDLWDTYGDGRLIASSMQRRLALLAVLSSDDVELGATSGVSKLVFSLIEGGLGSAQLDAALADEAACSELPAGSDALLSCVRLYEQMLGRAGLVDEGCAWAVLSRESVLIPGTVVELWDVELNAAQVHFLASQHADVVGVRAGDVRIERAAAGVDVRFAFPSGRYAEPALLVDYIESLSPEETVAIAARDPFSLYCELAPRLAARGISAGCRARIPFAQTDFGRALHCAATLLGDGELDVSAAADFALNPFSRMPKREAFDFAARIRGDRLIDKATCLALLREESRSFEYFEDLIESPEASAIAGVFEDSVRSIGATDDAYVRVELAAIGVLRDAYAAALMFDASIEACLIVLEGARVDASRATCAASPRVAIASQTQLADGGAASFDRVLLVDMTSDSYPLKEEHNAAIELLEALGLACGPRALCRARRAFAGCVRAARKGIVIERCLNDENAAPTYPAAVVQEFVDCYRDDPTNLDDIDNPFALPDQLQAGMLQRGEETLYENASASGDGQIAFARVPKPEITHISENSQGRLMLPRIGKGGVVVAQPCFSASQIESYLECPQKWFALRRLRLDELDEGFGAKEMGDFSHSVLEDFYTRFQAEVAPKVSGDTLSVARNLMRDVLAAREAAQYEMKPLSNRLVATSQLERREVADLKRKLVDYLDHEAELLPGFHPAHFEFEISATKPVEYAGHLLMGKIDRIDVDDRGRAVVIDYKSSLSQEYDLYEGEKQGGAMRNGKVQALIYAQAIRRLLDLEVVGALYVCYGRSHAVSGALDRSIEPLHVPGLKPDRCVYKGEFGPSFADLLDATEARVASALERLLAGEVPAHAEYASACSFCPELSCLQRRG